jgi:hypothetical protein
MTTSLGQSSFRHQTKQEAWACKRRGAAVNAAERLLASVLVYSIAEDRLPGFNQGLVITLINYFIYIYIYFYFILVCQIAFDRRNPFGLTGLTVYPIGLAI